MALTLGSPVPSDLDLPEKAVVMCMDEKSQVQVLDRTPAVAADEEGPGADDDL